MRTRRDNYPPIVNQPQRNQNERNAERSRNRGQQPPVNDINLTEIYENVKSIPNYSSKIKDFLRHNITSSIHKQVRRKFPRRRIVVHYPLEIVMSDLIDFSHNKMPFVNNGYRYIMVVIDCFSKMAWAEPMKRKGGLDSCIAIENVLRKMPEIPQNLITDRGLEYYDHRVQKLLDRYGIHHYSITGRHKACIAERFIRTLKGRMEKYFWNSKKRRWVDVLQQFISNYNKTYHRSIHMAPEAVNENNRAQVFKALFPKDRVKTKPRLSKGDRVRILREKNIFEKGYTRSWSLNIYRIKEAVSENDVDYYLVEDLEGNILPRKRYFWELNLVAQAADDN